MLHKEVTQQVINAAKAVHAELGPGLPHNFYRRAMEIELREGGAKVDVDVEVDVKYRDQKLGDLQVDFLVSDAILCLVIDAEEVSPDDYGRLRAMLKGLDRDVGLLLKFNGARLDVRRVEAIAKKQPSTT